MIARFAARFAVCVAVVAGSSRYVTAAESVSVRLNWIPGTEHSYFYLGKEKGWYAESGIDLEILAGQGSTVSVKTVGAGENTFAIADVASIARAWEAGVPLVAAAVLLKESPTVVYSLKAKNISEMSDLCGKKVGLNIKSTTTEQYRAMLRLANLKDCDITEVPVSGGGAKEVMSGSVDAAVIFSYEDPAQLQSRDQQLNLISANQYFKLYSLSIITNEETAAKKKDMVATFVKVTEKSIKYALLHPDEAKQAFLKTAPEADPAYENLKFDLFSKLLVADDPSGSSIGQGTKEGWLKSVKLLRELGIVKSDIDPTGKFFEAK